MTEKHPANPNDENRERTIIQRIVRFHISRYDGWQEEEDLVSACLLHWYEKRGMWDPKRANEETFLKRITEHKLVDLGRKKRARSEREASLELQQPYEPFEDKAVDVGNGIEIAELQAGVRAAIASLPLLEQEIAEALMRTATASAAARQLGISRQALGRGQVRIAKLFRAAHLEEFLA